MATPPGLVGAPSPGGPPPSGPPQGGGERQELVYLKLAMEAVLKAGQAEPDQEDKAALAKIFAQLQAILAKDQKESDQAVGMTPAHKAMRSQTGSVGPPL